MSSGRIPAHQVISLPEIHNILFLTLPLERDWETNHVFGFQGPRCNGYKHFCPCLSTLQSTVSNFSLLLYPCLPKFFFFPLTSILLPCHSFPRPLSSTFCNTVRQTPLPRCLGTSQEEHRELRRAAQSYFLVFCPDLLQLQCNQGDATAC